MSETAIAVAQVDVLEPWLAKARAYAHAAKAPNTLKAYRSDWRAFEAFCRGRDAAALPATVATVAAYAAEAACRLKANTVERHLTAISQAHQLAGVENPVDDMLVRTVLGGIRRVKGTAQQSKEPLSSELLRKMVDTIPGDDLRSVRDRALLLVGFAGAFRRTELVGLRYEDLRFTSQGAVVTIPRSKTDPQAQGQTIGMPYGRQLATCPVRALQAWIARSGVTTGFVFRPVGKWNRLGEAGLCDHQVARIVKALARRISLNADHFSGHSLRSGLATAAAEGGASERSIMDQTRHRSLKQVRKYIRRGSLFDDNAAAHAGL